MTTDSGFLAKVQPLGQTILGALIRRGVEGSIPSYNALPREFYATETIDVAKELLGKILVRRLPRRVLLEGRIVEVEAYRGTDDPASHAYRGVTERNRVMFHQVGLAYIYFIYGNHYCLNATAKSKSEKAGAVLLRALQPVKGTTRMMRNRGLSKKKLVTGIEREATPTPLLTNGPGKLTEAMQITGKLNGIDMTDSVSELIIREDLECSSEIETVSAKRIGISEGKDKPWRFYIKNNRFVSKP
jgi:DNA-3-methyladenine glycosylase